MKEKEWCMVMVNRGDAAAIGFTNGQTVVVRSRVGLYVPARQTYRQRHLSYESGNFERLGSRPLFIRWKYIKQKGRFQ